MTDRDTGEIKAQLNALRRDVDRLIMLVDGSEDVGAIGLRTRIERNETVIEEARKYKWILYGIAIGLGVTGLGSIGTFLTVLSRATGAP